MNLYLVEVFYNLTNLDVRRPGNTTVPRYETAPRRGRGRGNAKLSSAHRHWGLSPWGWLGLCLVFFLAAVLSTIAAIRNYTGRVRAETRLAGGGHCE